MGSVQVLANEIRREMDVMMPWLRKTVLRKLPLAVAAMIEARIPNTALLAAELLREVERDERWQQWLRRLLSTGVIQSDASLR